MLTPEDFAEVEAIFSEAVDLDPSARAALVAARCGSRADLRAEIDSLLAAHDRVDSFMEPPAADGSRAAGSGPAEGAVVGPWRLLGKIGSGGMGDVYLAERGDGVFEGRAAIKFTRAHLPGMDAARRFRVERQILASLHHAHIVTLLDGGTTPGGQGYLVMEYVEGTPITAFCHANALTLEARLALMREVCAAVQYAHERAIVHRDLKPTNILVTAAGVPKVLDFGVAKLLEGTAATGNLTSATLPGPLTPNYASPEQLRGRAVTTACDVYSLGVLLYEVIAGARPYETTGKSLEAMLEAVVQTEPLRPSAATADPSLPYPRARLRGDLDAVVLKAMRKDPVQRYASAGELAEDLGRVIDHEPVVARAPSMGYVLRRFVARHRAAVAVAAVALAGMAALGVREWRRAPERPLSARFEIAPPPDRRISTSELSPDGRQLAFIGLDDQDKSELWLRAVDSGAARRIPGTESAHSPFWSPDGRYLGFFAVDKLKTVAVAGGAPEILAAATADARGGSWGPDDVIVFAPTFQGGLMKVSARGGPVSPVTTLDRQRREESHRWPWFLPDGRHFLYQALGAPEPDAVYVGSLDGMAPVRVVEASSGPQYAGPGWLLFRQDRTLLAQPFDPDQLRVMGEPSTVIDNLVFDSLVKGARGFTASQTGLLAARSGVAPDSELSWLDRAGNRIGAPLAKGNYHKPRLSPDGQRLAVATLGADADLWVFDLARGAPTRFTADPGYDSDPMWSRDGSFVLFSSKRKTGKGIFQRAASGAGDDEMVMAAAGFALPCDGSPDGRFVLADIFDPATNVDLWILPRVGDGKTVPFLRTPFVEYSAVFSPDGRWVAYVSNESGRFEVYVRPFQWPAEGAPAPSGVEGRADGDTVMAVKWPVSTAGGTMPAWRHDGRELYYYSANGKMMAVAVNITSTFDVGVPVPLFTVKLKPPPERQYDVAADGRFLVNHVDPAELATPLTIALNWDAALSRSQRNRRE